MTSNFWFGFSKRAEVLAEHEDRTRADSSESHSRSPMSGLVSGVQNDDDMLRRAIPEQGPKLDVITEESDRGKFRAWGGMAS